MTDAGSPSDRDPVPGLDQLAREAQAYARPLPPARVRALGTRRRRRRHLALAVAAAAVAVVGGGAVLAATGGLSQLRPPSPAGPPTLSAVPASPSPAARTVTEANLLQAGDIPIEPGQAEVVVAPAGVGRSPDTSSACIPESLDALGATAMVTRNFAYRLEYGPGESPDPDAPGAGQPAVYTQALQFPDRSAAQQAVRTYQGWLDDCPARLRTRRYTVLGTGERPAWPVTESGRIVGRFTETVYREPGDRSDQGWFESVGLTQVEDRVMVTVTVAYGMDLIRSYRPEDVAESGAPLHEQFALIRAAAQRLR